MRMMDATSNRDPARPRTAARRSAPGLTSRSERSATTSGMATLRPSWSVMGWSNVAFSNGAASSMSAHSTTTSWGCSPGRSWNAWRSASRSTSTWRARLCARWTCTETSVPGTSARTTLWGERTASCRRCSRSVDRAGGAATGATASMPCEASSICISKAPRSQVVASTSHPGTTWPSSSPRAGALPGVTGADAARGDHCCQRWADGCTQMTSTSMTLPRARRISRFATERVSTPATISRGGRPGMPSPA